MSSAFKASFPKQLCATRLNAYQQKRYRRFKEKWASNLKTKTYSEQALQHFDIFYGKYFGKLWPSLRISLLSPQKYCALVNNFDSNLANESEQKLQSLGAQDFTVLSDKSINEVDKKLMTEKSEVKTDKKQYASGLEFDENRNSIDTPLRDKTMVFSDDNAPIDDKNTSLYDFMPTEKVYTEKELQKIEVVKQSTFEAHDIPVNFTKESLPQIPDTLKAFCFERGNIDMFPEPKSTKGINKLGYFMMDAASVLPVIALDLQPNDKVLDLCSAPGGKMLTMLQYPHKGTLTCNDISKSRLQRLKKVLISYGDQPMIDRVTILNRNGESFCDQEFDKVLVDAPCTNDRHSVLEDDNNIFKPGRLQERLELPTLQKNLLVSGIMSCAPGGYIVYSTCSLSPAQNDGVIQASLEHIWKETNINVNIVDLGYMPKLFEKTFKFSRDCRYGQLVIPSLTANFGPMYICKLKIL